MTDRIEPTVRALAEPPGGGRQDHDVMRDAASRPVSGPAGSHTVAAGGGLDVPGREPHPEPASHPSTGGGLPQERRELIPGERDASTLTHREPGAVGGKLGGADIPASVPGLSLDERTALEHAREGGGSAARATHDSKGR